METTTTYDKSLVKDLLSNRRYSEALLYIDSLDLKASRTLSREDIAHLYFAQAQCLYRTGNYGKATVKLKCAIKIAGPLSDNLLYARQKATLGQIYYEIGRFDDALEAFNEAHAFFRRIGDTDRTLLAREMIALIHFQKGNNAYAIELNESILSQALRTRASKHICFASFNLCRILLWTGGFARIRELLDSVADDCTDPLNQTWLESLWGTYYVRLLDHDRARKHLATAATIARKNGYRRDEVVCLEYLGLNEFYEGNYSKAKAYYEQILAIDEITASATAQTLRLLADVQVALGELDQAAETAIKAEAAITRIKEWVELGCLHRALALLADKRGDMKGVTEHCDKAIEILNRHGARYELAVTYLTMGQTRCLAADLKRERLQEAKAQFEEMDVPNRIAQVGITLGCLSAATPLHKSVKGGKSSIETPDIITQDPEMRRILAEAERLADTDETVLITGETGTGKDLLAKHIHCHSNRAAGPFCNENMSRFPRELIDSELFGYEKGSHSRAERNRAGVIESAEGGTFCLNEIVELPLDMQARLLQVIEDGTMRRVGGGMSRPVDVRFIAMTNGDLAERVEARLFRQDLLYRLQDFQLHLPPLRERLEDLPLLVQHFLTQLDFANYDLRQSMLIVEQCGFALYDWPGNVRELRGVLKKAVTLAPSAILAEFVGRLKVRMDQLPMIDSDTAERAKLVAALDQNGGNKSAAARALKIPLTTLWNQLKRHGIS